MSEEQADWGEGWAPERRWTADRRANPEARWTLVSCVVTPGFEYGDFELADREALLAAYPQARRVGSGADVSRRHRVPGLAGGAPMRA